MLVNACCRTLTAYSQGNWPLTAQMPLMQESETERMRRRLTGASGRRTSSEGFLHCRRVPFRMMRAGHRIGIQGQLSPDLVERDGERRETKVEVAASRREAPLELHEYAQSPVPESRMLSASSDQGQSCCHFPSLLVGEKSSESRLLILLMGKKPAKSFKEKCFTL